LASAASRISLIDWRMVSASGGGLRLLPEGFNPVDELYADDHLWQLVMAIEAAPALLCRLRKLEDHGECRSVRQVRSAIQTRSGAAAVNSRPSRFSATG
jgi:hypothetical protein